MTYQIEYAYTCHIGKVRNNNEDNFWCCGKSLEAQNQGMGHIQTAAISDNRSILFLLFLMVWEVRAVARWLLLVAEACGEHFKTAKHGIRNYAPQEFLNEML